MRKFNIISTLALLALGLLACEKNTGAKPEPPCPDCYSFGIGVQLVDNDYEVIHEDIVGFYSDTLNDLNTPFFVNSFYDTIPLRIGKMRERDRHYGLHFLATRHQDTVLKNMYRLPDSIMTWVMHWNSQTRDTLQFGPPVRTEYDAFTDLIHCGFTLLNGDTIYIPHEYPEPDSSFTISPTIKIMFP